jgi:hypothetical protein
MVTRGQRRIGKTIRKLEASIELGTKESQAKEAEKNYRQKIQSSMGYTDDSPIQNLRNPTNWRKDSKQNLQ